MTGFGGTVWRENAAQTAGAAAGLGMSSYGVRFDHCAHCPWRRPVIGQVREIRVLKIVLELVAVRAECGEVRASAVPRIPAADAAGLRP